MSRLLPWTALFAACVNAAFAQAAEDHAAHQTLMPDPQSNQEEVPRPAQPESTVVPDAHEAHQNPADEDVQPEASDPHAQHATLPGNQPTQSELRHVPPDPPQHPMHDMSNEEMIELMAMDDTAAVGRMLLDQFEWREIAQNDTLQWDGQVWYGNDYNKAWFKSEGEGADGDYEGLAELLWDRLFARWWSLQAGIRHDFGEGPPRTWAAFGVQGLAPHWFEVEATAYVGEEGRTAARFSGEYELLITQRLVLQPKIEFDLYGKDDPRNGVGSGLADSEIGLRLRYEFRREFAPYVGVVWTRSYGETADLARAAGHDDDDLQLVAGLRIWF